MTNPHRIVFANEKGGTGKSTTAVHVAIALAYLGVRVGCLDLDPRQRTLHRYMENRAETIRRKGYVLPVTTFDVFRGTTVEDLEAQAQQLSQDVDFLIFDTPGRDDEFARYIATTADTLITPLNDSFVDFDLIGQVDPDTFKVRRLSFYAELIWETRKKRAQATINQGKREMDWVVVRNRTAHIEARNMRRINNALQELSKRVGFRIAAGLSERVIYRELFPAGLTLLDRDYLGDLGTSHLVARQELRGLIAGLNLPAPKPRAQPEAQPGYQPAPQMQAPAHPQAPIYDQVPPQDQAPQGQPADGYQPNHGQSGYEPTGYTQQGYAQPDTYQADPYQSAPNNQQTPTTEGNGYTPYTY